MTIKDHLKMKDFKYFLERIYKGSVVTTKQSKDFVNQNEYGKVITKERTSLLIKTLERFQDRLG